MAFEGSNVGDGVGGGEIGQYGMWPIGAKKKEKRSLLHTCVLFWGGGEKGQLIFADRTMGKRKKNGWFKERKGSIVMTR